MNRPSIQAFKAIAVTPEYLNRNNLTDHQLQALKYYASTFTSRHEDIYSLEFNEYEDDQAFMTLMFEPGMADEAIYEIYDAIMVAFEEVKDLFAGKAAIRFGEPSEIEEMEIEAMEIGKSSLIPTHGQHPFKVYVTNEETHERYEFFVSAKDEPSVDKVVHWLFDDYFTEDDGSGYVYTWIIEETEPVDDLKTFINESILYKGFYIRKITG